MAWEYRVVTTGGGDDETDEDEEAILNELGAEGWELVSVIEREVYAEYPVEDESDEESGEDDGEEFTVKVPVYYFKRQS